MVKFYPNSLYMDQSYIILYCNYDKDWFFKLISTLNMLQSFKVKKVQAFAKIFIIFPEI